MTPPRIVVAGATTAITRRTVLRKMLWVPSDDLVHDGYLYALALAQTKFDVRVHHGQGMATHWHTCVTAMQANLPEFLRLVHRESARFRQEQLRAYGYDAPEVIWDGRRTHCMRLVDAGAQLAWLLYEQLNCVAAGLVERVEDYPGWAPDFSLMKGRVVAVKRPALYFGKHQPEEIELKFSAPPVLAQAFGGDLDAMVYWLGRGARELEDGYRTTRRREGRSVLGAECVRELHPWSEPQTPREERGRRAPLFKVGGWFDTERSLVVRQCEAEARAFVEGHRRAGRAWRAGDRTAVFPYGSYEMRVRHAANVADPPEGAILCAPGVVDFGVPAERKVHDARRLLDDISALVQDAAAESVDDLTQGVYDAGLHDANDETTSPAPTQSTTSEVVELEPPARSATRAHVSRVITLRTRRSTHTGWRARGAPS